MNVDHFLEISFHIFKLHRFSLCIIKINKGLNIVNGTVLPMSCLTPLSTLHTEFSSFVAIFATVVFVSFQGEGLKLYPDVCWQSISKFDYIYIHRVLVCGLFVRFLRSGSLISKYCMLKVWLFPGISLHQRQLKKKSTTTHVKNTIQCFKLYKICVNEP